MPAERYYRENLAHIHHVGFASAADELALGVLDLLADLQADATVLEIGCGGGEMTHHLVAAGFRVIATDASVAMLEIARKEVPGPVYGRLTLPEDPIPEADAIVAIGHPIAYVDTQEDLLLAVTALGEALRPGGLLIADLLEPAYGTARQGLPPLISRGDGWFLTAEFSQPDSSSFVRSITTFVDDGEGVWRRDDERHHNVLIDMTRVIGALDAVGVEASVSSNCGSIGLPKGQVLLVGRRRSDGAP